MPVCTSTLECELAPRLGQARPPAPGRGKYPTPLRVALPRVVIDEPTEELSPTVCGYRIGEMLGRGGMSVVFAVTHSSTRESLAMKVVTDRRLQDAVAAATIHAHAKTIAALKSPHIVRTLDAGRLPSNEPFVVMERLDGEDLCARLARDGALPIAEAMRAVMQACDGLAEAHAAGIVHGDIKPGNLVIVKDPFGASCLKIVDFAPAVPSAADPDDPLVTFSPGYAAPEQLGLRLDVDARADVWALGVVLRELVTGRRAFVGGSITEMVRAMKCVLPPMTSASGEVPEALEAVVRRCLQQDREQRFASVIELRDALALVMRGATTARTRTSPPAAPLVRRRAPVNVRTLFLAALGPASALVSMTLVRVVLGLLH